MPRATKAAWKAARERWERDETVTHDDIAAELGVARATVTQYAGRNGWSRSHPLPVLAEVVATIQQAPMEMLVAADVLDITVARRVEVLNQQREGWRQWREHFPPEKLAADEKIARRAKIAAEALALAAEGESSAWGLRDWDNGLPTLGQEAMTQQAAVLPEWVEPQRLAKARVPSVEALEAPDAPLPLPTPEKTLGAQAPHVPEAVPAPAPTYDDPFRPASSWHDGPNRPATGVLRDHRTSN